MFRQPENPSNSRLALRPVRYGRLVSLYLMGYPKFPNLEVVSLHYIPRPLVTTDFPYVPAYSSARKSWKKEKRKENTLKRKVEMEKACRR
ncbi:hypothetical protein Glove_535g35 [Diversispora epigaea]|uniref:Uncharacterized protein n=1 Tax=Diversispora epigaea TaxID=1348612 RepID=A0A397GH24_9GLOM|nr:hypothetical protein Glove_535g35 [Diversispora epigaea]